MPKTKQCEGAAALTMLGESSFYAVQLAREKKKGRSPKGIKAVAAKVQDCFIACKNESFLDWEKSSVEVIDNSRNVTFKKDTVQNIFGEVSAPIQLKFENTNYSVFDCTVPCQNCTSIVSPLKNEIECLKADLARRDAIIDGLLKKETPVKIKIPNYETQRREERKKACRSVGGLSRALFIGRLMHMLPFPSSLDMKNCFEATFEFLKSRNIVHASLLNDQETQKEILNFIGIEKGGLAGSSLKEIGEILIGGIDNSNNRVKFLTWFSKHWI